jgi:hypothetical protein
VTTLLRKDSLHAKRPLVRALLLGAPRNSVSRQVSSWAPVFSAQRWAHRFPLANALWRELRNSFRRISNLHEIGALDDGLDLNLDGECRSQAAEYQARTEGIRSLQRQRPWASLFDELVFLEGLTVGLRFHDPDHIPRSQVVSSSSTEADLRSDHSAAEYRP